MSGLKGSVCVEARKTGPAVWVAKYDRASGTPTRKVLGPAWVKATKRHTARGTTMWRSADGPKPGGYLTPKDAAARLEELLEEERRRPVPEEPRVADKTLADGAEAWLLHCEVVRELAPLTLRHYRSTVHAHLFPTFGPDTLLASITTASIDDYTLRLLTVDGISRSVVTQILGALRGILKRASKQGWIAQNPALEAESITPPRPSGYFNVLSPEQG